MKKVLILGVGNVGSTVAFAFSHHPKCPILFLYDKDEEKCKAQIEDLTDGNSTCKILPWKGEKVSIVFNCTGSATLLQTGDRDNELENAKKNVNEIGELLGEFDGIFVNIANPCDKVTALFGKVLKTPKNRILGTGTLLDMIRLRKRCKKGVFFMLGEHGDNNILITKNNQAKKYISEVKKQAWQIIKKKGCTNFGIANIAYWILDSLINHKTSYATLCVYHADEKSWYSDFCVFGDWGSTPITPAMNEKEKKKLKKIIQKINS